jgi:hypothetical protein
MALFARVARMFARTFASFGQTRRIKFGAGSIYFQSSPHGFTLFSGMADFGVDADVSVPEAKAIFESIRLAYDRQDVQEIKAGAITCTTDCRVQSRNPDRVSIKFAGCFGSTSTSLTRANIASAVEEFEREVLQVL